MAVVGIDIGYQTALVGAPIGGGIDILQNEYSQRGTASLVSFDSKQRILGEGARLKQVTNFRNTIGSLKRLIGRRFADPEVQAELSRGFFKAVALPDGTVGVNCQVYGEEKVVSITQLYAMLLVQLKSTVFHTPAFVGKKTVDAVLAVPAYYTDFQRVAVVEAAKIAGINCMRLMNETAAVALTYGIYKTDLPAETEKPRRVIFCDFGHSALQFSACEFVKGKVTILATAFDRTLGGRDFDLLLFDHFAAEIKQKYKLDVRTNPRACIRLEVECEKVKKQMSLTAGKITMSIECFMEDKDIKCEIVRDDLEALAAPLLARIDAAANRLISSLAAQNITLDDFSAVEVVGGTTRVSAVRARLISLFKKDLSTTLNIDEAVVRGASLQAAISSPSFRVREFVVIDKTQYAIDLHWKAAATDENSNASIYPENSPAHLSKMLTFYRDSPFEIEAKYGTPATVPDKEETIAKFQIEGITAGADGKAQKIKVKLRIDEFGVFSCESAQLVEKIAEATEGEAQPAEQAAQSAEGKKEGEPTADSPKEPAKEADKADADAKKKRAVHKTIDLRVQTARPRQLSQEALNALIEAEAQFQALDRQEVDRTHAKNSLEEYIYDMRNKVETFAEYFDAASSDKLKAKLDEIQNWLYDEGEDQPRAEYATRLQSMTDISGPALARAKEYEKLPEAENALRQAIVHFRKITEEHAAGSDKYSHIEAAEMAKVSALVAETEAFVDSGLAAQSRAPKSKPLTVTAAILNDKKAALEKTCNPIVKKAKPVVKEQPPTDATPPPATTEPAAAADQKQPESNPSKPTDLD